MSALPTNIPKRGLCREEAAEYIGVSPGTFDMQVRDGVMPKPIDLAGKRLVWDRAAIDHRLDILSGLAQDSARGGKSRFSERL